jgi:hypothetical protein
MHNGHTGVSAHQPRSARPFAARSKRRTPSAAHTEPKKNSQNAQRNYERYLALAEAQAKSGDMIGAENYYQHAEHYLRSMSADREPT